MAYNRQVESSGDRIPRDLPQGMRANQFSISSLIYLRGLAAFQTVIVSGEP